MSDIKVVMDEISHAFGEQCPMCWQDGVVPIGERHLHVLEWKPKDAGIGDTE